MTAELLEVPRSKSVCMASSDSWGGAGGALRRYTISYQCRVKSLGAGLCRGSRRNVQVQSVMGGL